MGEVKAPPWWALVILCQVLALNQTRGEFGFLAGQAWVRCPSPWKGGVGTWIYQPDCYRLRGGRVGVGSLWPKGVCAWCQAALSHERDVWELVGELSPYPHTFLLLRLNSRVAERMWTWRPSPTLTVSSMFFFFFFNIYFMQTLDWGRWGLVPWSGIKPTSSALGAWSLN